MTLNMTCNFHSSHFTSRLYNPPAIYRISLQSKTTTKLGISNLSLFKSLFRFFKNSWRRTRSENSARAAEANGFHRGGERSLSVFSRLCSAEEEGQPSPVVNELVVRQAPSPLLLLKLRVFTNLMNEFTHSSL